MKIYIGADHNGFDFKTKIIDHLQRSGYEVVDEGGNGNDPADDFPRLAGKVVSAMLADNAVGSYGILICGSGQGMCIAANRFKGIRASICWDLEEARASRNDDDANILCLSSRYTKPNDAIAIVQAWLSTPFAGAPRFKRRIQQLDELGG
ncbi:MAG: RpiB/LacA/LacB family sugar-phosphate isomerase [Candidatus Saccharimonadales bacterium]